MGTKVIFKTWAAPSKRRFTVTDRTHEYSITMGFPLCRLSRDECAIIRRRIATYGYHFVRSVGKWKSKTEKFKRIIKVIQSYDYEKYFRGCIYLSIRGMLSSVTFTAIFNLIHFLIRLKLEIFFDENLIFVLYGEYFI